MKVTVCEQFHWKLSQFGWDVFQQVSPRNSGFRKGPTAPPAVCSAACLSWRTSDGSVSASAFPGVSVYWTAVKSEVLFSLRGAIINNAKFHVSTMCLSLRKGFVVKCGLSILFLFIKIKNNMTAQTPKFFYQFGFLRLCSSVLLARSVFSWGCPASSLCDWTPFSFLSCWGRWAVLCCPDIQRAQAFFTWQSGSWLHLQGWKRSQNISCGFSIADEAQSHSWRRYT